MARHKFHAKQTEADGIKFASKLESRYYKKLKMLQQAGEIVFFLRQVPLHLEGGVKLVVDFVIFWKNGDVTFEDTKGLMTSQAKQKIKQAESRYPIKIKIVTRV